MSDKCEADVQLPEKLFRQYFTVHDKATFYWLREQMFRGEIQGFG